MNLIVQRKTGHCDRQSIDYSHLPRVIANSFPKSGTNLLRQVLSGIPKLTDRRRHIAVYKGPSGEKRSVSELCRFISDTLPGEIVAVHLFAYREIKQIMAQKDVRHIFIYRDLRDVVVSHAFYVTAIDSQHVLHRYYNEKLGSLEERITCSIQGLGFRVRGKYWDGLIDFPDISKRFQPYKNWLSDSNTCLVKFEELVDQELRIKTCYKILDYLALGYDEKEKQKIVNKMVRNINPKKSPTFRKGIVGDWKNYFTEKQKVLFKKVAGQDLITLGYEQNLNW